MRMEKWLVLLSGPEFAMDSRPCAHSHTCVMVGKRLQSVVQTRQYGQQETTSKGKEFIKSRRNVRPRLQ